MSTIELLISGIGILIGLIAAAFGIGHSKGKAKAEKAADEREMQTSIDSMKAANQRQAETTKGAADVQDTVSRMSGSAVDDELLRDWTRKD